MSKTETLPSHPHPAHEPEPSGIAADDAGATSLAEKAARAARPSEISDPEKAGLGEEASRDEDA